MRYISTRGKDFAENASYAVVKGIAGDGGLFVPETIPAVTQEKIKWMSKMDYKSRAYEIMSLYLDDFDEIDLKNCIDKAYNNINFDDESIAPLRTLNENLSVMELWHGPTAAFKDMALQLMPHLFVTGMKNINDSEKKFILTATSGDTGKAALQGFMNVPGVDIMVFYPDEGVSEMQKMQMVTQEGENVHVVAVQGNFDDTQSGVKEIFGDKNFIEYLKDKNIAMSSANSINWGRLLPQIVYYFSAYCDLLDEGRIKEGEKINFCVPTGNFGNILAGFYAMKMGLPINRLICASNENNVLSEFFTTGVYDRNREFKMTASPSMDILISSNFERFLFEISKRNSDFLSECMEKLKKYGSYRIEKNTMDKVSALFWGSYSTDRETFKTIEAIYGEYKYLLDPHTAVAVDVYDKYVISASDLTHTVVISTASPFKFTKSVACALYGKEWGSGDEFVLMESLSEKTGAFVPEALKDIGKKKVLHTKICSKEDMKSEVEKIYAK